LPFTLPVAIVIEARDLALVKYRFVNSIILAVVSSPEDVIPAANCMLDITPVAPPTEVTAAFAALNASPAIVVAVLAWLYAEEAKDARARGYPPVVAPS
jgi:hypothetical protein